jgi:hypothetical protein
MHGTHQLLLLLLLLLLVSIGPTRLGDVCISPYSVNWDCRAASFEETCKASPNQCNFPAQRHGPADDFLFGQCEFYNVSSQILSLALEVKAAADTRAKPLLPRRNDKIQKDEETYHARMAAGTGLGAPKLDQKGRGVRLDLQAWVIILRGA